MRKFDLIVFDWDGTLMDSAGTIARCVQNAFADLALPVPSDAQARYIIGLGMEDAMRYLCPDLPLSDYQRVAERYRHHFLRCEHEPVLFEEVALLLELLKNEGYLLAIATGKSRVALDRVLAQTDLTHWFDVSRCADECFSKPHPAMLYEIMESLYISPEKTLMVGDTTHDLQMAINANCSAIAVECGAHEREALEKLSPLTCLTEIKILRQWLTGS